MKKLWILPLAAIMMVACGPSADDLGSIEDVIEEATEAVEEAVEEGHEH